MSMRESKVTLAAGAPGTVVGASWGLGGLGTRDSDIYTHRHRHTNTHKYTQTQTCMIGAKIIPA